MKRIKNTLWVLRCTLGLIGEIVVTLAGAVFLTLPLILLFNSYYFFKWLAGEVAPKEEEPEYNDLGKWEQWN